MNEEWMMQVLDESVLKETRRYLAGTRQKI